MASILAMWGFSAGFFEFLLNPTVGKLSDTFGRKPFMLLSPFFNLILKVGGPSPVDQLCLPAFPSDFCRTVAVYLLFWNLLP
jgi:MFS family permease